MSEEKFQRYFCSFLQINQAQVSIVRYTCSSPDFFFSFFSSVYKNISENFAEELEPSVFLVVPAKMVGSSSGSEPLEFCERHF